MTPRSILNLCIKVMGVYYALSALNMIPSSILQIVVFWEAWKYTSQQDRLAMMVNYKIASLLGLFTPILLFAFSLLIIFKSEKITNFLLRKEQSLNTASLDDFSCNAINLSIRILGFFSFLSAIPYISELLSSYWVMRDDLKFYDKTAKIKLALAAISAILYIGVGLVLVLYSSVIADRLLKADSRRTREVDTTETEQNPPC